MATAAGGGAQDTVFEEQLLNENPVVVKRHYLQCGQNSKDQPDAIEEHELATLQNADTTSAGVRKTRLGLTAIGDDPALGAVVGLGRFYVEGGTKYLTRVVGTKWQSWSGSGSFADITGATSLTSGTRTNLVVAGNRQFLLNGVDHVFSTANGTTATDEGNLNTSVPISRFGIYHQNMLIVSGNSTNRSYIWPSTVLAPQTFDRAGRAIKVENQNGDEITAMVNMSLTATQGFVAFKTRSTYFIDTSVGGTDPSQWSIIQVDPVHGAVGDRAACALGASFLAGDCAFLSKEGARYRVRSLRRTINDKVGTGGVMSFAIEDVLEDVNDSYIQNASMWYFDNRLFLAIPSGSATYNDTLCVLDLKNSDPDQMEWKWSIWTGWKADAVAAYEESGAEYFYIGDASGATSKVWRALSGSDDDGTAISYSEESRREDFGYPELDKVFQFVEVVLLATDQTTVTVEAQVDGNGYTALGTMTAASAAPTLPVNLPFNLVATSKVRKVFQLDNLGLGRDIQIRITHSEAGKTVNVLGYTFVAFLEPLHLETRT